MDRQLPPIIQEVGFDFRWDERKVWRLDVPIEEMSIDELAWHLTIPFLWSKPDGYYDITPAEVLSSPARHPEEFYRVQNADTRYRIDVMYWRKRWVILDGLHRLMKLSQEGSKTVMVRKIPISAIDGIRRD